MNGIHTKRRSVRKSLSPFVLLCFAACFVFTARAASAVDPAEQGTLMLVREWDPNTGELVGWLPIHHAAMRLTILDDRKPALDLNEPVTIKWILRPNLFNYDGGEVLISPEPRVVAGERWLPAKRDGNVVRIGKRFFLIRSIIFGESKWRHSTSFAVLPDAKK